MKLEDIRKLINRPESEVLEFKSHIPDARHLAAIISAFANTDGGRLIVGIRDDGSIVGLDDADRIRLQIKQALKSISPPIQVEIETVSIDGKSILVVTVPKGSQSPYLAAGLAFQRLGARIIPITSQVLYSEITKRAKSLDDLRAEVEQLSRTIETLNYELIAARNWKTKTLDMVLGGIIGATISIIISLAFGL